MALLGEDSRRTQQGWEQEVSSFPAKLSISQHCFNPGRGAEEHIGGEVVYRHQRIVSLLPTLCRKERRAGKARQPLQEAGGLSGQLSCWEEARAILPQCPAALREEISHGCWCRWPRGLGDGLKQEQGLGQLWQRRSWGASSPHTCLRHGGSPGMGEGWHGGVLWQVVSDTGSPSGFGRWHRQLAGTS